MTTTQKAAISLLIAVLLFGGFSVLAFTGLFNLLETGFYSPSVTEDVILLPTIMKIILLFALFLTTYLIIFLLFNLRQDPLIIVQNRLKQLQVSLIEQFYERKGEADWARWILELEQRREEIRGLLKRGIKADSAGNNGSISNNSGNMDILIDKSWDELLAMLGSRRNPAIPSNLSIQGETGIDEAKIASVLQKLLKARTGVPSPASPAVLTEEIEVLEELDEAESNEDFEIAASDVDILARQIEFSHDIETEKAGDGLFNEEMEVVSPFSTMVFDSSLTDNSESVEDGPSKESRDKKEDDELSTGTAGGLPLITTPFSGISNSTVIGTLEIFNAENEGQTNGDDNIINEKEGVHYIGKDVLAPTPEFAATLNPEFKNLVDSVMK